MSSSPDATPAVPPMPSAVLDPRPALVVGTVAWLIGALVVALVAGVSDRSFALCLAGVGVGLAGTVVYGLQRRAVQRGARGSQQGLDFDTR